MTYIFLGTTAKLSTRLSITRPLTIEVVMMVQLAEVIAGLEAYVGAMEPDRMSGADAAQLVRLFEKGSRLCAAGRSLVATRAAAANAWKREGFRSPEEWLAAKTKTTRAAAAESLRAAQQMERLPATREAFVSGQVSADQAAAIAAAASLDPSAEAFLLHEAERSSLGSLQKTSRALVAAAAGTQAADRERIHQSRYWKSWTSRDGAFEGRFRLTVEDGALVLAAIDTERREVFTQARAEGRRESSEAYNADAFVNMARITLETCEEALHASEPVGEGGSSDADLPPAGTASPDDVGGDDMGGSSEGLDSHATEDDAEAGHGHGGADADMDAGRGRGTECHGDGDVDDADGDEDAADRELADSIDHPAPDADVDDAALALAVDPNGRQVARQRLTPPDGAASTGSSWRVRKRRGRTPPNVVHIRVDLEALLRGHTQAGEVCEAVGVGQVSVETAQHALCDAIVRLLNVKDGQVIDICHAGRTIPTKLAVALEERDRTCAVPGCDTARHLQNHHLHPVNFLGPTSLANLAKVCSHHHDQITHEGAQLTGTPGNWTWHPPGTNVAYPRATQWPATPASNQAAACGGQAGRAAPSDEWVPPPRPAEPADGPPSDRDIDMHGRWQTEPERSPSDDRQTLTLP